MLKLIYKSIYKPLIYKWVKTPLKKKMITRIILTCLLFFQWLQEQMIKKLWLQEMITSKISTKRLFHFFSKLIVFSKYLWMLSSTFQIQVYLLTNSINNSISNAFFFFFGCCRGSLKLFNMFCLPTKKLLSSVSCWLADSSSSNSYSLWEFVICTS